MATLDLKKKADSAFLKPLEKTIKKVETPIKKTDSQKKSSALPPLPTLGVSQTKTSTPSISPKALETKTAKAMVFEVGEGLTPDQKARAEIVLKKHTTPTPKKPLFIKEAPKNAMVFEVGKNLSPEKKKRAEEVINFHVQKQLEAPTKIEQMRNQVIAPDSPLAKGLNVLFPKATKEEKIAMIEDPLGNPVFLNMVREGAIGAVGSMENITSKALRSIEKSLGRKLLNEEKKNVRETLDMFRKEGIAMVDATPEGPIFQRVAKTADNKTPTPTKSLSLPKTKAVTTEVKPSVPVLNENLPPLPKLKIEPSKAADLEYRRNQDIQARTEETISKEMKILDARTPARMEFINSEQEVGYQNFKQIVKRRPYLLDPDVDEATLKRTLPDRQLDRELFSGADDKTNDELLESFRERYVREKELDAVAEEKTPFELSAESKRRAERVVQELKVGRKTPLKSVIDATDDKYIIKTDKQLLKENLRAQAKGSEVGAKYARAIEKTRQEGIREEALARQGREAELRLLKEKILSKVRLEKADKQLQKIVQRKTFVRAVRDHFGLSDDDLKTISRADTRLMSDEGFERYISNIEIKASELAEKRQALNELNSHIEEKEFQKVDNVRASLKLPDIENMTVEQLQKFDELLSQYKKGDIFLPQRKLETLLNTPLADIRTEREVKEILTKKLNLTPGDIENIGADWSDRFRWDTALAEKNKFYGLMVDTINARTLNEMAEYHIVKDQLQKLTKDARKSRKGTGVFVPQDKRIFEWLEASDERKPALANEMTTEELALGGYIRNLYASFRDYLVEHKMLQNSRENYITHIQMPFWESVKDEGISKAMKDIFKMYKHEEAQFNILNRETDEILALEKFFRFTLRRTGEINPTMNVARAVSSYAKAFYRKKALDSFVPELDTYVQVLTPKKFGPRGLELDRELKKFTNEYLNTKKGRTKDVLMMPQGSKPDVILRAINSFMTTIDLGFSMASQVAAPFGEKAANYIMLGARGYAKAARRAQTAQGRRIVEKYKNFVGEPVWEQLTDVSKNFNEKASTAMFLMFARSTRSANIRFLLGNMTKTEFFKGEISDERLAELTKNMGRHRVVDGSQSVVGATTVGKIGTKYKTWAIPTIRTTSKNISTLVKMLSRKGQRTAVIKTREFQELYRVAMIGAAGGLIAMSIVDSDEDDGSFVGKLKTRIIQDGMSSIGAFRPNFLGNLTPRMLTFFKDIGEALDQIVMMEEYADGSGNKGIKKLGRILTPAIVKQIQLLFGESDDEKHKKGSLPSLPKLPKLPSLPKLPKIGGGI